MLSPKPWRPDAVLILLMGLFACMWLGLMMASMLTQEDTPLAEHGTLIELLAGTLSFHGMLFLLLPFFLRAHQINWSGAFGFSNPNLFKTIGLAVLVGLAVLPIILTLSHLSARLLTLLDREPVAQQAVQTLQTTVSVQTKVLIGVLAVGVAPVAEEVLFRGIIYPAVKQYGYPHLAMWGTSILFAFMHGNVMIFIPLVFLAVVLTLLYESTNNLLAPIVAHALFNFANFFWLVLQPGGP
jgi:membrane protease YdiL (CAAX protease family)